MSHKSSLRDLRALAAPLYVAAFLLAVMPLIELGAQLGFSAKPDSLQWRTGTVGLFSSALLTPTFGLIIGCATAYACDHVLTHRVLTWLAGFVALVLIVVAAFFALDAFQLRAAISPTVKRSFTLAMVKAILNFGLASCGLLIVFVSGLRAARRDALTRVTRADATDVPLLVRR